MAKIHIPTPLRQYAGKQASVEVRAGTVGEALTGLISQHPDLRRHLYTDDGRLRAFVNVYLNDEDIRYLQKEATTLADSDNISIVPSIAGGSPDAPEMKNPGIAEVRASSTTLGSSMGCSSMGCSSMGCCCPPCCCR